MLRQLKTRWMGLNDAAKASLVFMMVSFLNEGIRFITTPIYTRLLTAEEYGITSVYYSWEAILGVFTMLSLQYGIFNNGMFEFKNDRDSFISSILFLSNLVTVGIFCVLMFLVRKGLQIGLNVSLIYLMFIIFMVKPANNFWVSRQRYEFKYIKPAIISAILAVLSPAFGIFFLLYADGDKASIKLWASYIPSLVIWFVFYLYTYVKTRLRIRLSYVWYAFKLSIPLVPHYASQYILSAADRIMIDKMVNEASAGIYGISATAAAVVSIIWNSINAVLTPWTYEKMGSQDYQSIYSLTKWICVLYAVFCSLIMLTAPEIMWIVAPSSYHEGTYLIPPIIAATYFSGLYTLFGNVELFYKKVNMIMIASIMAAGLNVVLNVVFIKLFGYHAAAYTTLFCYLLYTVFHYLNMKKIEKNKVYDIRFISGVSAVLIGCAVLSPLIYDYFIIRYLVLICALAIICMKRRNIIDILKKLR